ncbi:hypothetical protein ACQP1S_08935 [Micromonospora matsumotoense]|uniref:hypothetical protein n=1 Tax=Micromonospora matsumotoense TaxID=121616 RepID=UPI003D92FF42
MARLTWPGRRGLALVTLVALVPAVWTVLRQRFGVDVIAVLALAGATRLTHPALAAPPDAPA